MYPHNGNPQSILFTMGTEKLLARLAEQISIAVKYHRQCNLDTTAVDLGISPSNVTSLLDSCCLYLISADSALVYIEAYPIGTVQVTGVSGMSGASGGGVIPTFDGFVGPEILRNIYNWGHVSRPARRA